MIDRAHGSTASADGRSLATKTPQGPAGLRPKADRSYIFKSDEPH